MTGNVLIHCGDMFSLFEADEGELRPESPGSDNFLY